MAVAGAEEAEARELQPAPELVALGPLLLGHRAEHDQPVGRPSADAGSPKL